jgi:hypothetical protein
LYKAEQTARQKRLSIRPEKLFYKTVSDPRRMFVFDPGAKLDRPVPSLSSAVRVVAHRMGGKNWVLENPPDFLYLGYCSS